MKRLEKNGSPIAEETLLQVAELYTIEKTVRGMTPKDRLATRWQFSASIITAFRPWLEAELSRIPRSSASDV